MNLYFLSFKFENEARIIHGVPSDISEIIQEQRDQGFVQVTECEYDVALLVKKHGLDHVRHSLSSIRYT